MGHHIKSYCLVRRNSTEHKTLVTLNKAPDQRMPLPELKTKSKDNYKAADFRLVVESLTKKALLTVSNDIASMTEKGKVEAARLQCGDNSAALKAAAAAKEVIDKSNLVPPCTHKNIFTTCPPDRPVVIRSGSQDFKSCPSLRGNTRVFDHLPGKPVTHQS